MNLYFSLFEKAAQLVPTKVQSAMDATDDAGQSNLRSHGTRCVCVCSIFYNDTFRINLPMQSSISVFFNRIFKVIQ